MIKSENRVGRATSCMPRAMFSVKDSAESLLRCGTS